MSVVSVVSALCTYCVCVSYVGCVTFCACVFYESCVLFPFVCLCVSCVLWMCFRLWRHSVYYYCVRLWISPLVYMFLCFASELCVCICWVNVLDCVSLCFFVCRDRVVYDVYVLRALFVRVVYLLCLYVLLCVLSKTYIPVMSVSVLVCLVYSAFLWVFFSFVCYVSVCTF